MSKASRSRASGWQETPYSGEKTLSLVRLSYESNCNKIEDPSAKVSDAEKFRPAHKLYLRFLILPPWAVGGS